MHICKQIFWLPTLKNVLITQIFEHVMGFWLLQTSTLYQWQWERSFFGVRPMPYAQQQTQFQEFLQPVIFTLIVIQQHIFPYLAMNFLGTLPRGKVFIYVSACMPMSIHTHTDIDTHMLSHSHTHTHTHTTYTHFICLNYQFLCKIF